MATATDEVEVSKSSLSFTKTANHQLSFTNGQTPDLSEIEEDIVTRYIKDCLGRYAYWCDSRPWTAIFIVIGVVLTITIAVGAGQVFNIDEDTPKTWNVLDSTASKRMDALEEAIDDMGKSKETQLRSDTIFMWNFEFMYRSEQGNILTPEGIGAILKNEAWLFNSTKYHKDFCWLLYSDANPNGTCADALSWTSFFPNYTLTGQNPTQEEIDEVRDMLDDNLYQNGYFFDKNFVANVSRSQFTRTLYYFGSPLAGYKTVYDEPNDQMMDVQEFHVEYADDLADKYGLEATWALDSKYKGKEASVTTESGDTIEILWFSWGVTNDEVTKIINLDFLWAVFCIISVWIYMAIHTQSLMLASFGMFEIVIAFPVTYFFYDVICRIIFFQPVHILAIFVVLGIGADDVFVFVDAFKQSMLELGEGSTPREQLKYAVTRACMAIFATSVTTAGAFLATSTSTIMPISSFGFFATWLILILFCINAALMPPVLVIWSRNFSKLPCCVCCTPCWNICVCCKPKTDVEAATPKNLTGLDKLRRSERFFYTTFSDNIVFSKARYGIVGFFTVILVVGFVFAVQLEPPDQQADWFSSDHFLQKYVTYSEDEFSESVEDPVSIVDLCWGVEPMSRAGVNRWDPNDRGSLEYDDSFDLSDPAAQRSFIETCQALKTAPCSAKECNGGTLVRYGEVKCFMEGFGDWLDENYNETLPLEPPAHFVDRLFLYADTDAAKFNYTDLIGFVEDSDCTGPTCVTDSTSRTLDLKFVRMQGNSTFEDPLSFKTLDPMRDDWEDFIDGRNDASPETLNKGFQVSYSWSWADTQRALVDTVKSGMGITFALAFAVLVIATGNLILAVISIITIAGIVITVLGVGAKLIMGWSLDVTESISAVILIGLSVDYCVHLAHAYMESPQKKRGPRMRDALTTMGISVTAGAVTTFLAGAFLFGAVLPFFNKFGFIVVFTVVSSYSWSVFFFSAACAVFGPEDQVGNVLPMMRWVYSKCTGKPTGLNIPPEESQKS